MSKHSNLAEILCLSLTMKTKMLFTKEEEEDEEEKSKEMGRVLRMSVQGIKLWLETMPHM